MKGLALHGLVTLACAVLAAGCADAGETPCLAGARVCFGSIVRLCDPATQRFVDERVCPAMSRCMSGECEALVFDNDAAPADAREADAAPDVTGDAGAVPDVATAAEVTPDIAADAGVATDAAVDADTAPEVAPDAAADSEADADAVPDLLAEVVPDAPDADAAPGGDAAADATADAELAAEAAPAADATADAELTADTAPDATTTPDAVVEPPVPFTPSTHHMLYDRIGNIALLDDLSRVAFHPSGDFAVLVGTGGKLAHYAAGASAITAGPVLGGSIADLAADPSGAYLLAAGTDKAGDGVLYRITASADGIGATATSALTQGGGVSVVPSPEGARFAIGTSKKSGSVYINTILIWQDGVGVVASKTYADAGLRDLMWASPALWGGSDAIITGDGVNGAASRTWVLDTDLLAGNGWSLGFGNPGGGGWRPGGGYGAFTGWTSNKLYVYDGAWTIATLPDTNTGASPNAIAWSPDGRRALIVGRALGSPLRAIVVEHRPLGTAAFDSSAFIEMSVPAFDASPWFGNSNVHLQDVAWRPGAGCAEGLIVASDTGSTFSPGFGIVIRFRDGDDAACWP